MIHYVPSTLMLQYSGTLKGHFTFIHLLFPNPVSILTVTCHITIILAFNFGNSALHVGLYTTVLKHLLPSGISGDKTAKTPA